MGRDFKEYFNEDMKVRFHAKRCIHAARCVKGLPDVFDTKKRPWINVNGATAANIAEIIERCPSGALEYTRLDNSEQENYDNETMMIEQQPSDVIYLRGNLSIQIGNEVVESNRASLCGCGLSKNKPFCDLSGGCKS
ncbi:(4Fe-4S)-binding protein [Shimazuella kribbensis]|uniref:(4Fe-4S)-binding protein n=1 Tax=Shimazuella kribbensis TaxID=139808 RepID=UPI0003FE1D43|nr:(4Fe-4S)-binding protein [Shimazuella kribbensis]